MHLFDEVEVVKGAERLDRRLREGMRGLIVDSYDTGFELHLLVEFSHNAYGHLGGKDVTIDCVAGILTLYREPKQKK